MIPLTKTLDPADFAELTAELGIVDQHFTSAREQHPMRRWEYAMAIRALHTWGVQNGDRPFEPFVAYDIGGAGSPFKSMVRIKAVIDPDERPNWTLEQFVAKHPLLANAVFCLSVLEHVDDLDQFLYYLSCLVAPGGLLFLTMDCCGCDALPPGVRHRDYREDRDNFLKPEQHHFHWMRKRIFTRLGWGRLRCSLSNDHTDFQTYGGIDRRYHGDHVYDYSFASLALVKRQ